MDKLGVVITIIGVLSTARAFFVENYLRLLKGDEQVNLYHYFLEANRPQDAFKLLMIIPMFSNGRENEKDKVLRHRFIVNVLTVIIYILLMIMFAFIFEN